MKVVILATRLPYPVVSGGVKRLISICEHLRSLNHVITLITFIDSKEDEKYIADGSLAGLFEEIYFVKVGFLSKLFNLARGLFSDKPFQVLLFRSLKMRSLIARLNNNHSYDLSICHMIRSSEYQSLIKADKKIIELTDSIALNYFRKADDLKVVNVKTFILKLLYSIEARRLKKAELDSVESNHKSIVVSSVDKEFILSGELENNPVSGRLVTIPLGIPNDMFVTDIREYDENTIVFLGKMNYAPNEQAVLYFVDHIFPGVKKRLPGARFRIVGASPSSRIKRLALEDKSVCVTGRVDNLASYVTDAALSVALMQSGAGMQTKILESIALGVPVVTNQLGFDGINLTKNVDIMVALDDIEAIEKICELMENPIIRIDKSMHGQKTLFDLYSSSQVFRNYVN